MRIGILLTICFFSFESIAGWTYGSGRSTGYYNEKRKSKNTAKTYAERDAFNKCKRQGKNPGNRFRKVRKWCDDGGTTLVTCRATLERSCN